MTDPSFWSATKLAKALREKEISAREVVEKHLARIEATSASINAVVQLATDRALAEANRADSLIIKGEPIGALHGVPITVKDSLDSAGVISTGGTMGRVGYIPEEDATVVARLRTAGAILLGKTNTPELTMSGETVNLIYGRSNNPYDVTHSTGGSSGGSAANVAVGGAALEVGSDTGGSIREPAHYCGIAGLKPNAGRIPRTGHIIPHGMGAVDPLTQLGPMARYVEDLALALPIMCGPDWHDVSMVPMPVRRVDDVDLSQLRIAYYTDDGVTPLHPEIGAAVENTAAALAADGLQIDSARPRALEEAANAVGRLRQADGGGMSRRLLARAGTTTPGPDITDCFFGSSPLEGAAFSQVLEEADTARSHMLGFLRDYDAIVCPTSRQLAPEHGSTGDDTFLMWSYSMVYNLTGWPAVTVRTGTSSNALPIGLQVVAAPWREDVALALAARIEYLMGGFEPPDLLSISHS